MLTIYDVNTACRSKIVLGKHFPDLSYLFCCCVQSRRHWNLVLGAGRYVKGSLSNDWHIQVMHDCHLESLASLVVVAVVE